MRFYLGIDVGTHSARAGIFDDTGKMHASSASAFAVHKPAPGFVECASGDIWRACGDATRAALALARLGADAIAGIGFDATCSLVIASAGMTNDVIVWMDHRATDQARRINETKHDVLRYVGGVISPEMEMPKLLWLKEHEPEIFRRARAFYDLPDFLVHRATGSDVRSLCTTVCKWTYLPDHGWDEGFLRSIGLGEFVDEGFARIGTRVRPMGESAGGLTEVAARELGLAAGTPVSVAIIDAHAGGLGLLGDDVEHRLALICGTSSCAMAVSREPKFVPGVWGPYFSAMVPGMWLTEGGQSATGALVDHVIGDFAPATLNAELDALAKNAPFPAWVAQGIHVLPDHHGNRSPRADSTLRGMISGVSLESELALVYLATVQAIAHGAKHVIDTMRASGLAIETIVMCGGDAKNPLFLREHADITGCRIVLPKEPEAVMLGAAILGRVACGDSGSVTDAMTAMCHDGAVIEPAGGAIAEFHAKKHRAFLRMHDDQLAYRDLMK